MKDNSNRLATLFDLFLLEILVIIVVSYYFRGATSACDGFMHLSKINISLNNLRSRGLVPDWNPYWYFGVPMWRTYSPLSYWIMAFLGWFFNLSLLEIVSLWAYLVFSVASLSTYLLARRIGLNRFGCFTSSLLFLSSANLIVYWGNGSYPNVTGVAFSPVALLLFLKAIEQRNLLNVLAAGWAFSLVLLTYLMNAVILFVFMVLTFVVLMLQKPPVSNISREQREPLEQCLVLLSITLIAVVLSLWWTLPFLTTLMNAPAIPSATELSGTLADQVLRIFGPQPNIYSPGTGHLILAIIGCIFIFLKYRASRFIVAATCFLVAFIFSFTPWLRIPTGPFYWWRFSSYLSLFAALCGGIMLEHLKGFYEEFFSRNLARFRKESLVKIFSLSIAMLVLVASIYPVLSSSEIVFTGYDISRVPAEVLLLESHWKRGERVGIDGGYGFNIYMDIPQSGGGDIYYVYLVNEFAYTFWDYIFVKKNSTYLPYFARNYNVRWLIGANLSGVDQTAQNVLYEVENFNSSFVEAVGTESILMLFIGEYSEYFRLFTAVASGNPQDIVLVYGGENLEGYSLEVLRGFNLIYLSGLRYGNLEDLGSISRLLLDYAQEGGGLILDTGTLSYGGELDSVPDPFPITQTTIYGQSNLALSRTVPHSLTENIDFTKFGSTEPWSISYAKGIKADAIFLVHDEDRPVMVYWEKGSGKVLWTGLRLPYLVAMHQRKEEVKFLIKITRSLSSLRTEDSNSTVSFDYPNPEEILVHVKNASIHDAVWVKMSYYPGWTAQIESEDPVQLRIFQAGPNMMLVFPRRNGDYTVRFYFDKTLDVQIGETVSQLGVVAFLSLTIAAFLKKK